MEIQRIKKHGIKHYNLIGRSLELFCEWKTMPSVNQINNYASELEGRAKYIGRINGSDLFVYRNKKEETRLILGTIEEVKMDRVELNTDINILSPKDYGIGDLILDEGDRKYCVESSEVQF